MTAKKPYQKFRPPSLSSSLPISLNVSSFGASFAAAAVVEKVPSPVPGPRPLSVSISTVSGSQTFGFENALQIKFKTIVWLNVTCKKASPVGTENSAAELVCVQIKS